MKTVSARTLHSILQTAAAASASSLRFGWLPSRDRPWLTNFIVKLLNIELRVGYDEGPIWNEVFRCKDEEFFERIKNKSLVDIL